ncbi:SSU ribosomal protein S6P [Raineyella antarctica]|jgi:small subunit ribosomal protein S6|uniref:Small ribosomal subunit protein bS6 n=1 Tax=Raineyella antarctica TaxID=1577474 RepID=A0A1G6HE32_9ACTN|nr:30S ribosomal protein S6 [Raineyella antarctica]SDB92404.1 SSU ribosomal protein S6P [Raineyella antarctica]
MRKYEVMVLIDPDTDDRQVTPMIDKHLETITNEGGTVDNVDHWGKRKLAYEINKKSEAYYAVISLTAAPASVQEMDRLMTINEQIMRTKVLRPDLHA